jgi:CubicO group peptidase (beta-lactamase class C family)
MPVTGVIDHALKRAAEACAVPGVVAMAADADGVIYEGAFGKRTVPGDTAMTIDTVFWLASMTKAITSVAAMQFVEQGKLTLDTDMASVVPELAGRQVLEGFDANGAPKLRPARRPITLRHLLTHTAGFSYDIWSADIARYMEFAGVPGIITCQNAALSTPLLFDPGDRWEYGTNVDFAGKAVEAISGQSLDDYLREHIFSPLGMKDAGFRLTAEKRSRLAAMHVRQADGSITPIEFELPQEPEFFMGGGGLYGTGSDFLRFIRMILGGGSLDGARILRRETVADMARNQIGAVEMGVMTSAQPQSSNDVSLFPGMVKKWGLGFMINTADVPDGRAAGSLAWAGLGNTYFWIDPQRQRGGVILTQILPFADPQVLNLLSEFERGVYQA